MSDQPPSSSAAKAASFRWGSLLRPYRAPLLAIGFCLLAQMTFYSALPMSFQVLIDRAVLKQDRSVLVTVFSLLLVAVVVAAVAGLWQDRLSARVIAGLLRDLRARMFEQLQRLSLSYYSKTSEGDIVSRFSGDLHTIEEVCTSFVPWVVLPALSVLSSTVLLFLLDWRLALLAMLVWPVCLLGPRWTAPKAIAASYEKRDGEAVTASQVQENVAAQQVVKVFNLTDHSLTNFDTQNEELSSLTRRLHFFSSLVERSSTIGNTLLQVLVLGVGATLAFRGDLSVGSLTAFQSLFLLLSEQLAYVMQYTPNLIRAAGSVRRISSLLHAVPEITDSDDAREEFGFDSDLSLDGVSFSYDGESSTLTDVSLKIRKGQFVALVGPSGCGKSTVLSLILRLYDPKQGAVRIDDHDLRDIRQAVWRGRLAPVLQDNFLFDTTIRENIRLGRLEATDEEVEAAAKAAEIDEVIRKMPRGYKTKVGQRGGQLSGGQRQRIAIARAILRDPTILVLDEATSALDATSEAAINETLTRLAKDRTVISVTHRLSSVVNADQIFVFQQGRLIEQGRHEELLARGNLYAQLWQKQAGFEADGDGADITVTVDRLKAIPLLSRLDNDALAKLVSHFEPGQFGVGRVVVQEGDPGDKFYLIVRGKLEVFKDTEYGTEKRLVVLSDGDFFGEIALLRNVPRTASVRTLTPSVLLSLSRKAFLETLADTPQVREELERVLAERK
ncbi:MAG: ATP-binding cassette domain-containing protein [Planctomycetaceae bacterium]|nr:ATP-binding cassette domain-containing protein [Planctomycetaceae bacterium]